MFKTKIVVSISLFIAFLLITSAIKNKTRILEKQIVNLNKTLMQKKKNINEAQLDFYYLTTPVEIEKKLSNIGFYNYKPIKYSNIYFDISDFTNVQNKMSILENSDEKKIQKK